MSMQPARDMIRQHLADLRVQISNTIFQDNTYPYKEHTELTLELQKEYQDLLIDFLDVNGKVQAVPVYHKDCTANAVRIQTSKIGQLFRFVRCYSAENIPRFLADEPRHSNGAVYMDCPVVKAKDGCTRKLARLSGSANEPREDKEVRKWVFADLREDENIDTLIREKARWGWCGKFGLSRYFLIRQEEPPVDVSVPTLMLLQ